MTQPTRIAVARTLWAKSPKKNADGSQGAKLLVLNHCLDVAACAAVILQREPERTRQLFMADLGLPEDQALPWLLVLIALHDLGKASPAFQVLWKEGEEEVHSMLQSAFKGLDEPYTPHGVVTESRLPILLEGLDWDSGLAEAVSEAVGCHHGFRVSRSEVRDITNAQLGDARWGQVRKFIFDLILKATGANPNTRPTVTELSPAAFMRLAGLTSFADWLGSSFALPIQMDDSAYDDPAAYFEKAKELAEKTVDAIHWPKYSPLRQPLPPMSEVFDYLVEDDKSFQPRPLQSTLESLLIDVKEPTLVIVEAPMGEGKTEAALYGYLQLQNALQHRGLYIALPTQATGNAMYKRFREFLGKQGRKSPPDLQLAHGGTLLDKEFQEQIRKTMLSHQSNTENDPAEQNADKTQDYGVRAEEWFSQRKRALLSEYGVGTIDQALLGILGVAHQFVRLWGLGNRVIVLDEVHAYDTYTSELIAAFVSWMRALGSSVIIMSATLPKQSRQNLLDAWGVKPDEAPVYPRLTVAQAGQKVKSVSIPDTNEEGQSSREKQEVQLKSLGSSAEDVAHKAVDLIQDGGCVAIIVNTVGRAQDVQKAVMSLLAQRNISVQTCTQKYKRGPKRVGVLLYHARYPADERKAREDKVLQCLGKPSYLEKLSKDLKKKVERPERYILIATQVAEQSLDFDADVMITDLAPIDLILQRAGRLHRHKRDLETRHSHQQPVLYVSGLNEWPKESMAEEYWDRVYAPALLYKTWHILQNKPGFILPDDLDHLVQTVYAPEYDSSQLESEQIEELKKAEKALMGKEDCDESKGVNAHIGLPDMNEFWQRPLNKKKEPDTESVNDDTAKVSASDDSKEEFPTTRLGEQGLRIVPVTKKDGVWIVCSLPEFMWQKDKEIGKPRWKDLETRFSTLVKDKEGQEYGTEIYRRSLSVSRWEVVKFAERVWGKQMCSLGSQEKKKGWKAHPLLRNVIPVYFENGLAEIEDLVIKLDEELGLVFDK